MRHKVNHTRPASARHTGTHFWLIEPDAGQMQEPGAAVCGQISDLVREPPARLQARK